MEILIEIRVLFTGIGADERSSVYVSRIKCLCSILIIPLPTEPISPKYWESLDNKVKYFYVKKLIEIGLDQLCCLHMRI